jgi:mevalonate kinase
MSELSENTKFNVNVKTIIAICAGLLSVAAVYFTLIAEIQQMHVNIMRMESELEMNSEFRIKWPRGELGSLPDDAEQNMRLIYLEKYQEKVVNDVDKLKLKVKEIEACVNE